MNQPLEQFGDAGGQDSGTVPAATSAQMSDTSVVQPPAVAQEPAGTSNESDAQLSVVQARVLELERRLFDAEAMLGRREHQVMTAQRQINEYLSSRSWRVTAPLRQVSTKAQKVRKMMRLVAGSGGLGAVLREGHAEYRRKGMKGVREHARWLLAGGPGAIDREQYAEWIKYYDTMSEATRTAIRQRIASFGHLPLISVLMLVRNPKSEWLVGAIESLSDQLYSNWQLCIADVSGDPAIRALLERHASENERVKIVSCEPTETASAALNHALALASGEWVTCLGQNGLLSEHAFYCIADLVLRYPDTRLIYSDEDQIDAIGVRHTPYFKCDWSPDLFYSQNYFGPLGVYQKALLDAIGGFREGFEGAETYDLTLRCLERVDTAAIRHIPRVLYHNHGRTGGAAANVADESQAIEAGARALDTYFDRCGVAGSATWTGVGYHVRYTLPELVPLVSLIIPTRNGLHLIRQCIESIVERTRYPRYEIIVVDNGSDDPETLSYFASLCGDSRIRVLRDDRPFNYSALNNAAIAQANGELVGLINNDIEVISPDWLTEMVGLALQPGIGAVGAKLLFPNDTLQHGGVILGIGGIAGHANKYAPQPCHGYFNRTSLIGGYSAVTAACLVIRKSIYFEVGGLNELDLTVAYNDVDFCLRVREKGYRNVWTPYAELYHHESATRGNDDNPVKRARYEAEVRYMLSRWNKELDVDPAYSPNLSMTHEDFSLAWPPRLTVLA